MDQTEPWVFERVSVDTREEQRAVIVEAVRSPVVPWGRDRSGRRWQPVRLRVTIERYRHNVGPWTPWRVLSYRLIGWNVKADGSTGAERFERTHSHGSDHPAARRAAQIAASAQRNGMPLPLPAPVDETTDQDSTVVRVLGDGSTVVDVCD